MKNDHVQNSNIPYVRTMVCCCLLFMVTLGSTSTFSVCLPHIVEELHTTRTAVAAIATCCSTGMLVAQLLLRCALKRFSPKQLSLIGCLGTMIHFSGYIFSNNIYLCWLCGFCGGFGTAWCANSVLSIIITKWFLEKRAQMLTIITACGVSYIFFTSRIASLLVQAYSYRASYAVWCGMVLLIGVPAALLLRNTPQDVGLQPKGYEKLQRLSAEEPVDSPSATGLTLAEARKTPAFWFLAVAIICMGLAPGIFRFLVDYFSTDCGFAQTTASTLYGSMNLMAAGFLLFYGRITDYIGSRAFAILSSSFMIAGAIMLMFCRPDNMGVTIVAVVLYAAVSNHAMVQNYPALNIIGVFGLKDYRSIVGFLFFPASLGSALSNLIIGGIRDATGSYAYAFIFCSILGLIALVCALTAYRLSPYHSVTLEQMESATKKHSI